MDGNDSNPKRIHQGKDSKSREVGSRSDFIQQVKVKAASYCAYQERTQQDVRDKLYDLGLHKDEVEDTLTELITNNFVNEERFARSFARGKFRFNKWGKVKIAYVLRQKGLSDYCQQLALDEIDDEEYIGQIRSLIIKKISSPTAPPEWEQQNKIAKYVIGKGYESELVWQVLKDRMNE